jgi:hypothetical protein
MYETAGRAEMEVSLARYRFHGGVEASGVSPCHWLIVHLGSPSRMSCRIGKHRSDHVAMPGTIALPPAGVDVLAETDERLDALILALPREPFALLAAERAPQR